MGSVDWLLVGQIKGSSKVVRVIRVIKDTRVIRITRVIRVIMVVRVIGFTIRFYWCN